MITDDEIRRMVGHPDAIPSQCIEWFLKGYRQCEAQQQVKNLNIPDVSVAKRTVCVRSNRECMHLYNNIWCVQNHFNCEFKQTER